MISFVLAFLDIQFPRTEIPGTDEFNYNDIFKFLRGIYNTTNLTESDCVTLYPSSTHHLQGQEQKAPCDVIVASVGSRPNRFLTEDEPWILNAYLLIDFHHTRVTLSSYTILLNARIPRYMRSFRITGEIGPDKWVTLADHKNITPYLDPEKDCPTCPIKSLEDRLYRYHFNITRNGTFSRFRIENTGPDSYTGDFQPHANMVSISKLLFFGAIENNRIIFSPDRLAGSATKILAFGTLSVFS